ncbi:MAG: DUF3179 domain-containing protein [Gammaproteobacteria bacterium]|nr:DUF3179 domain-containing protein [Gammaproteobacteria bacterium]
MKRIAPITAASIFAILIGVLLIATAQSKNKPPNIIVADEFISLLSSNGRQTDKALDRIEAEWQPGFAIMAVEIMTLLRDREGVARLVGLLEENTNQKFGFDIQGWRQWLWNQPENKYRHYAQFKSELYRLIDPLFAGYFNDERDTTIRLDEVVWGGVRQDGIPPLRNPKMIHADDADYLDDGDVVFAIEVNGDARAYPKRIMAWHEMFVDEVGGTPVAGVYCTLCGSMILYNTEIEGKNYEIGTSGFLYRSNKLMYDKKTQSLWNTLWGTPVIGPLVGKDIALERLSIVTTTWKEWQRRHPQTKVLSLDTGHQRDYGEGVAYREYFATDNLMFGVPTVDGRLKNKSEVLGLLFAESPDKPLAISADYLAKHSVYQSSVEGTDFVVFTDVSGANRVYDAQGVRFESWDQNNTVMDESGQKWHLSESRLETTDGKKLFRLPAHRAFWFGWFSAYSHTQLVH